MSRVTDNTTAEYDAAPQTGRYECTGIRCAKTAFVQIGTPMPHHEHKEQQGPVRWRYVGPERVDAARG
jgi:hypothetical protein